MKRYAIETTYVDRGGPNHGVIIRRHGSASAVGVGTGPTLTEALNSAVREVRLRRRCGQFHVIGVGQRETRS